MEKSITIVGGGLAGLSLGIGLRSNGIPVTIHEAGRYPRHRVCGEFICGVDGETLKTLSIGDVLEESIPNRSTAWFRYDREILQRDLPFSASGISRYKLDNELASRFEKLGGDLCVGSRFRSDGVKTDGVVFASGRPREPESDWIGLKCHLPGFSTETDLEMHLGEGGYLGLSQVENEVVNACGLFRIRSDIKGKRETLLARYLESCGMRSLASRIRESEVDTDSAVGVNAFRLGRQRPSGASERFAIGDQFAIIGPFAGNGMSMAFESAAMALEPLIAWSRDEMEWSDALQGYEAYARRRFRSRMRLSGLMHPFLVSPIGQNVLSALASTKLLPFTPLFHALR